METWETDTTGLAATLMTEGYELLELDWRPAPRLPGGYACYFVFAWLPGLEDTEDAFYEGSIRVDPQKYGRVYGQLRRRMHASRKEQISEAAAG